MVATTFGVRRTPISGEITTGQLVPSCLLCGDRPIVLNEPEFGFPPIAWPMLSAMPADQRETVSDGAPLRLNQQTSGTPLAVRLTTPIGAEPVQ